ncbi:MAG: hypothetical protein IT189_11955 [Microbacteriaceae bacterium]|nr:hypothetical protein [Microbacteriaceae bacterium]
MRGTKPTVARVRSVKLGEHHGFVVINRRIKATPEHPFLVRRGDEWGFVSAEFIKKGDYLIGERLAEELVQSVDRVDAPTRTVSIYVPGTNVYSAEEVWTHNDLPAEAATSGVNEASATSATSASGSASASASGSGSTSGSSSGSSSSGSGSKSSGSSFSSSSSGSGSMSGSSTNGSGGTGTYSI